MVTNSSSILTGDTSIRKRPMKRVIEPLTAMGADTRSARDNGCAPLIIRGGKLHATDWTSSVASAQVKSCILLAGLCAGCGASVTEPALSRDHSERMLLAFGADVQSTKNPDSTFTARIAPSSRLKSPGHITVPGDISSAAYFLAAALMVPGSEILVKNVGINPTRAGILTVLERMGAEIIAENVDLTAEPRADLRVRYTDLKPQELDMPNNGAASAHGDV